MGKLALVYWAETLIRKMCPHLLPLLSPSKVGRRASPMVTRVELAMSLTGCIMWESRPCTLTGHQGRLILIAELSGDMTLMARVGESWWFNQLRYL